RRRGPSAGCDLRHETVAPENQQVAVEDGVEGSRGGREVDRIGVARDVDVAAGRIDREVVAALRLRSSEIRGIEERLTVGAQLGDEDIRHAIEEAIEGPDGDREVYGARDARHPGVARRIQNDRARPVAPRSTQDS